jgi:hypothetical protein
MECAPRILLRSPGQGDPSATLADLVIHRYFKDFVMTLSLSLGPVVSLIAGILILIMPRLLSTIVAIYLILMGVLGLLGMHALKF